MTGGRATSLRAVVPAAMLALTLVLGASIARADADPASDYLLQSDVFYPFETKVSGSKPDRTSRSRTKPW